MARELQDIPNRLSRRNWLRDAAITATGAVMLPSLLTGCDHREDIVPGGLGSAPPLTPSELKAAAQNLVNMNDWLNDLHGKQADYELTVLEWLKSGDSPSGWSDFIINILLDIGVGVITAAAEAATAGAATAALAITAELIKKFAFPDSRPNGLDGVFAEFKNGQDKLHLATSDKLLHLVTPTNDYKILRDEWPGDIEFNGKKYTLRDLANSHFPVEGDGDSYIALRTAALLQFKKYIWNVMIAKAGSIEYSYVRDISPDYDYDPSIARYVMRSPIFYARDIHYKNYPATYLRGFWNNSPLVLQYVFRYWYLTFDGRELSADAAKELFKDDTPENIINPEGLFNRDYVFKQFHREKPRFFGYHDLRKDLSRGPNDGDAVGFDLPDDFEFTGGYFPQLIKK